MGDTNTLPARFDIPKDYIEKVITAEIARALGDPAPIIENFVKMALNQKVDNWGNETFFTKAVKEAIQEATKVAFTEWLADNQEEVKKQVKKFCSARSGMMEDLVKKILESMAQRVYVSVNIDTREK